MTKKVGIADIAKALGLSRNTVSKALNGSSGITSATRQRVIDQAIQMNYKMMGAQSSATREEPLKILLVCKDSQLVNDFFGPLMLRLQNLVYQRGAVMTVQYMLPQDIETCTLPAQFQTADGIIGLEILDRRYIEALLSGSKPCAFFDACYDAEELEAPFDVVLEGDQAIYHVLQENVHEGFLRFGYVGSVHHCLGFEHRYDMFRLAMADAGITGHEKHSILFEESKTHSLEDFFCTAVTSIQLPQVMCFANSHLCSLFIRALHLRNPGALENIKLVSFGANHTYHQSQNLPPVQMTTVKTNRKSISSALVMLIFDRISHPDMPQRILFTKSQIES
jgi:LacI family transcriptional regulator